MVVRNGDRYWGEGQEEGDQGCGYTGKLTCCSAVLLLWLATSRELPNSF